MAINNLMNAVIQPSGINVYDSIWGMWRKLCLFPNKKICF